MTELTTLRKELTDFVSSLQLGELTHVDLDGVIYRWENAPADILDTEYSLTSDPKSLKTEFVSVFRKAWTTDFVVYYQGEYWWDEQYEEDTLHYTLRCIARNPIDV